MSKYLFWLCILMFAGNMGAALYLIESGQKATNCLIFGLFWSVLAFIHATREEN